MVVERRPTILIADGDDVVREALAGLVRGAGYNVIGARDGSTALAMLRAFHVDVLVVDATSDVATGVPVVARRGAAPPRTVVLHKPAHAATVLETISAAVVR